MRKRKNVGWRDGFDREGSKMMDECGEADKGLEICSGLSELERDYGLRCVLSSCLLLLLLLCCCACTAHTSIDYAGSRMLLAVVED